MTHESHVQLTEWLQSGTDLQRRLAQRRLKLVADAGEKIDPPRPIFRPVPERSAPEPSEHWWRPLPSLAAPGDLSGYRTIDPHVIISTEQLVRDTVELARHLPPDIDLVVAIARSGLVPGGLVASLLHLPLATVTRRHGIVEPGHGGRMAPDHVDATSVRDTQEPRHILLVDDTAARGYEMRDCSVLVAARWPEAKVTKAVVYCHPQAAGLVDVIHALYPGQHYLEWNWPNAGHGEHCGYDFDGILCDECPVEDDDDGPRYRRFLETARPLYLPRRKTVPLIVTARHEKYRDLCMDWLDRHGVKVQDLVLRDADYDGTRSHDEQVGEWKAACYGVSICTMFAESSPVQAEIIASATGKRVLCPSLGRVIVPG